MFSFSHRKNASPAARRTLALMAALAIALTASGCNFLPTEEEELPPPLIVPEEIEYKTITVEPSSISNTIRDAASIISARQESVSFTEVSGRIDSIEVDFADKVQEGDLLASLMIGDIEDSIVTGELEYRKVEINYLQARERYNAGQITALDLEKYSIDLELSRIRMDRLRAQLESSRIVAPFSGQVVYVAELEHNDRVETYVPIVTIADMTSLLIRYEGENYKDLVPGTKVTVMVAREIYTATVIASGTNAPDGSSLDRAVLIQTDTPLPDSSILGANAYFEYELERSDDTIVIPKRLLNTVGGRQYVNVLVDGIRVERDVLTGIENNTDIEILSGLAAGDLLIDR